MRRAFSLIELMIVIVIIGVVYTLVIIKLDNTKKETSLASLSTLKEYLQSFDKKREVELRCKEECHECSIYVDKQKYEDVDSFFDTTIERYRYRYTEGITQFREDDICFRFKVDAQGVADQILIFYNEKVYDYSSYFDGVKVYDSLNEAQQAKDKMVEKVLQ